MQATPLNLDRQLSFSTPLVHESLAYQLINVAYISNIQTKMLFRLHKKGYSVTEAGGAVQIEGSTGLDRLKVRIISVRI